MAVFMCFQASLATFEKPVFFVLSEHEIPGGLLQRHSQQNPAACTSMMFILLIRNQSCLCARRGLDSQASEMTLWAQLRVCKLWLKHCHRDYKTAGKLHPRPSHCCSETAWQSLGRAVYCEGLLIKWMQVISSCNVAKSYCLNLLAPVHVRVPSLPWWSKKNQNNAIIWIWGLPTCFSESQI